MALRITTWNVNGIRNPFSYQPWRENRTFQAMFDTLEADIVVMQETKIQRKDLRDDMVLVPGWDVHFSLPKHKKGYAGVAIYTRNAKCCPVRAEEGITGVLCPPNTSTQYRDLSDDQQIGGYPSADQLPGPLDAATLDSEGRCLLLEFPAFVLVGIYCPAAALDESRTQFRLAFLDALDARVRNLAALGKQVVLAGDLNIARGELDTAGLPERLDREGTTLDDFLNAPSRRLLNHLVFRGGVVGDRDAGRERPVLWDLCREFHPARPGMYTCWNTKMNARPGNFGSRIDYVLCTAGLRRWFVDADIQQGLMGSDHCPAYATLADAVEVATGEDLEILDVMNPPGMFRDGERLRDWDAKDLLPGSARLIPEFKLRRSIRDMFRRAPNASSSSSLSSSSLSSLAPRNGSADAETAPGHQTAPGPSQAPDTSSSAADAPAEPRRTPPAPTLSVSATASLPAILPGPATAASPAIPPPTLSVSVTAPLSPPLPTLSGPTIPPILSRSATASSPAIPPPTWSRPATTSPAIPPPEPSLSHKRPATPTTAAPGRPQKRTKATPASGLALAQRSLKGFFKPRAGPSRPSKQRDGEEAGDDSDDPSDDPISLPGPSRPPADPTPAGEAPSPSARRRGGGDDTVFDPVENKESWSRLLGKRVAPRCEHEEPCTSLVTKKPGVNCGRSFYMCARPLGPSGEKEKGTQWRCGTFVWSSDWNKTGGGGS